MNYSSFMNLCFDTFKKEKIDLMYYKYLICFEQLL